MNFDSFPLGVRKIRSAGRRSGSVVLTLPAEMAGLEGLDCVLALRGGKSPTLLIQPNMDPIVACLTGVWTAMQDGLHGEQGAIDLPGRHLRIVQKSPRCCVVDGSAVLSVEELGVLRGKTAPVRAETFSRFVRALVALDALARGRDPIAIDPYARTLAFILTGDAQDQDLFALDLTAVVTGGLPRRAPLTPTSIGDPKAWRLYQNTAQDLAWMLFEDATISSDRPDARADWARAMRFARVSA